jgi:hypothetical protein
MDSNNLLKAILEMYAGFRALMAQGVEGKKRKTSAAGS